MKPDSHLSLEELWQTDGHASELALTVLADGQDELLPAELAAHVHGCDACTARLGSAALLSVSLSEALAAESVQPLPVWPLVAGVVVALAGAVPALTALPAWLAELPRSFSALTTVGLKVAGLALQAASSAGPSLLVVWILTTLVLGLSAWMVARLAPRRTEWKGART